MTDEETNEPNEFGYSGAATGPEPHKTMEPVEDVDGESIAVPSGDLTGAITEAIEELTEGDEDKDS